MQYNIQKESFIKKNYIPILITLGFFFAISYIAFFHYEFVFNSDGLIYLRYGEQILSGDGENVLIKKTVSSDPIFHRILIGPFEANMEEAVVDKITSIGIKEFFKTVE